RRNINHANNRFAVNFQRYQHTIKRHTVNKSKRPVDRIDDPTATGGSFTFTFFFAEYTVGRKTFRDLPAQVAFGFAIRNGNVTAVSLGARLRPLAKVLQSDVARAARELDRKPEQ